MQHSRVRGPLPGRRTPVICTGFFPLSSALVKLKWLQGTRQLWVILIHVQINFNIISYNKDIQIPSKHNKIYYTLPLPGYMFRLLRLIIRPSNELTQNYLIPSALWDPVALTIVGAVVLWVHVLFRWIIPVVLISILNKSVRTLSTTNIYRN